MSVCYRKAVPGPSEPGGLILRNRGGDQQALGSQTDEDQRSAVSVGSGMRDLRRRSHSAMRGTGACFEIAERPPATSSNISVRIVSDVPIRYSTVGAVPSARSAEPSSGKLLR